MGFSQDWRCGGCDLARRPFSPAPNERLRVASLVDPRAGAKPMTTSRRSPTLVIVDGLLDRGTGAWRERDGGVVVAFALDGHGVVPAFFGEVVDDSVLRSLRAGRR
jgi:hypothetical protein